MPGMKFIIFTNIILLFISIFDPFRIEIDLMTYDVESEKMTSRMRRYVRAICSSSATNTSRRFWFYLSYAFADLRNVAFIWKFRTSARFFFFFFFLVGGG